MKHVEVLKDWLSADEGDTLKSIAQRADWEFGRQGTGYQRLSVVRGYSEIANTTRRALELLSRAYPYDAWLLQYPEGSSIPPHTDPSAVGLSHVRVNVVVSSPNKGGELYLDGKEVELREGDAYLFRPDKVVHEVGKVACGSRLIFSVGANLDNFQLTDAAID